MKRIGLLLLMAAAGLSLRAQTGFEILGAEVADCGTGYGVQMSVIREIGHGAYFLMRSGMEGGRTVSVVPLGADKEEAEVNMAMMEAVIITKDACRLSTGVRIGYAFGALTGDGVYFDAETFRKLAAQPGLWK